MLLFSPPSSSSTLLFSLSRTILRSTTTMSSSISNFKIHAFAGHPMRSKLIKPTQIYSTNSALQILKTQLLNTSPDPSFSPNFKILPFQKGKPLASSEDQIGNSNSPPPPWHLAWISLSDCKEFWNNSDSDTKLTENSFVYLGSDEDQDVVYWAIDVSDSVKELRERKFCFVELRTLMVATDWSEPAAMGELAVAGHARALLEWHNVSRFCGHCGQKTVPVDAGRRKKCSSEDCKTRVYPRVDPVVIMLVIDKENDRALLGRQSRFVPRMWSCLAGFIEPGESLEEAVRRETWEESGVEVGEVVYHSSQPWPVGPSSMPCQLMVGFFAYAKSVEINVDKEELEDAQWHSREDVRKALTFAEYEKAQKNAAAKVDQMCKGVEKGQNFSADYNVESGELAPMFIPGPFAIAHHLISSWVNEGASMSSL
ncbi:NAD(+) diphosphatase [Ranunculus cassubicifolius]